MNQLDTYDEGDSINFETETQGLGTAVTVDDGEVRSVETESGDNGLGAYRKTTLTVTASTDDGFRRYRLTQYETDDGYGGIDVARTNGSGVGDLNCGTVAN